MNFVGEIVASISADIHKELSFKVILRVSRIDCLLWQSTNDLKISLAFV